MSDMPRRDFLAGITNVLLAGSGLLVLGGLLRFLSFQTEPPRKTEFDLGPASDYAVGSRTVLPDVPAILIHSEAGFSALSLVCTHLGCTVELASSGFICPCHGSHYDAQGNAKSGPSKKPLPALRLEMTPDDNLHLFTN
jgi:cytochrome b6-f complex iron-sulfur subunit